MYLVNYIENFISENINFQNPFKKRSLTYKNQGGNILIWKIESKKLS